MTPEKIETLFSKLIRKYIEVTYVAMAFGLALATCVLLVKLLYLIPFIGLLAFYAYYTNKWLAVDMPTQKSEVKRHYFKGFLKYSILTSLMIIAIWQKFASLFTLLIIIAFLSYVYDALHVKTLIILIKKEVDEK